MWTSERKFRIPDQALLILDGVDEVPLTDGLANQQTYPRACLLAALADGQSI